MKYILLHFMIFALPVSLGLGLLAAIVRVVAGWFRVRAEGFSLKSFVGSALLIGIAGSLGQMFFQALHYHVGWNTMPARYTAYLLTGILTGAIAHNLIPCTTYQRTAGWGLVGGLAAELGFSFIVAHFSGAEIAARIASEALLCAMITLAVQFDLEPDSEPVISQKSDAESVCFESFNDAEGMTPTAFVRNYRSYVAGRVILPTGGRIRNCLHCIRSSQTRIRNR